MHRHHQCRRAEAALGGDALPFVLPGARATFTPPREVNVRHLRIEVALDFAAAAVEGACTLTLVPLNDGAARVALDAVEMEIHAVTLGGDAVEHAYDGQRLTFTLAEREEGEAVDVVVRYRCTPRRGLYFIRPDDAHPQRPLQAWSQGQDEDNRAWFPCFDHPTMKSTSEVIATVPAQHDGAVERRARRATRRRARRPAHRALPPGGAALELPRHAGGRRVRAPRRTSAGDVELHYFVQPGREEDAPRTFGNTPRDDRAFADKTGRAYPWQRYSQITVAEFIFGGMENTSRHHADRPDAARRARAPRLLVGAADLARAGAPVVRRPAHLPRLVPRLAQRGLRHLHASWSGRSTAPAATRPTTIASPIMEAYLDEDAHRYRRPIVTNVYHEPIDVFDRHLYEKGGCVLHMLRSELGDERFWKAIRHYVHKHAGGSVETRDLARAVDEATGVNTDRFFEQWVFKAGHPELKVETSWDDDAQAVQAGDRADAEGRGRHAAVRLPAAGALRRRRRGRTR